MSIIRLIRKHKLYIIVGIVMVAVLITVYIMSSKKEVLQISQTQNKTEEIAPQKTIRVYVTGEINHPKIVEIEKGTILNDIIILCGGLTENASQNINLVYEVTENVTIFIKEKNYLEGVEIISNAGEVLIISEESGLLGSKVNINIATVKQLMMLPGIGESTANAIVNYRNQTGKFATIDSIMQVPGIKEAKFILIRDLIAVY